MEPKQYDIPTAAEELGFSQAYIRTLIRKGTLKTTRVPLSEGSLVTKHVISEEALREFENESPHKSRRLDGRNKFIMYLRPDEYMPAYQALSKAGLHEVADLLTPANKLKFWEEGNDDE